LRKVLKKTASRVTTPTVHVESSAEKHLHRSFQESDGYIAKQSVSLVDSFVHSGDALPN